MPEFQFEVQAQWERVDPYGRKTTQLYEIDQVVHVTEVELNYEKSLGINPDNGNPMSSLLNHAVMLTRDIENPRVRVDADNVVIKKVTAEDKRPEPEVIEQVVEKPKKKRGRPRKEVAK